MLLGKEIFFFHYYKLCGMTQVQVEHVTSGHTVWIVFKLDPMQFSSRKKLFSGMLGMLQFV
jgi:hypothetical protein